MPTKRKIGDRWPETQGSITYIIEKTATGRKRVGRITPYVCPGRVNTKTELLGLVTADGEKRELPKRQPSQSHGKPPARGPVKYPTKTIPLNAPGYRMERIDSKTYKQVRI